MDSTHLLFDLQQLNGVAQRISGCLVPDQIAHQVTAALVEDFDCVFARIWLVEPDHSALRLVASSGLYTHTNGTFARVPMGAYKVGKIAQNRVPFLSNHLAAETWVKDPQWAIDQGIQGFAGYPLMIQDRVLGVLAAFSRHPLATEFLEVLQVLCMITTIALESALKAAAVPLALGSEGVPLLSDQLATILPAAQVMLVGREVTLPPTHHYAALKLAASLEPWGCTYCRLTYDADGLLLDTLLMAAPTDGPWADSLEGLVHGVGGTLQVQTPPQRRATQLTVHLPYPPTEGPQVGLICRLPLVRAALVALVTQAGFALADPATAAVLITDSLGDRSLGTDGQPVIGWRHRPEETSPGANEGPWATWIDWTTSPSQLRTLVNQLLQGEMPPQPPAPASLSQRERQVLTLLAQGLRDRDIAQTLFISESTVKFHLNNSLIKLQAKNRYQAVYKAAVGGCL